MEEKNQVFHIPIHLYEKDMDTIFSRDKKKEIIELFTNHNHIRSQDEFDEIKFLLHDACEKGDLKLIEIYLNESITDETNDLKFKINKSKKTASLFKINNKYIEHLIVPRTVKHESEEYLITSICRIGCSELNIKTIKFVEDSLVSTIYSNSFSNENIEEIYFPKSLKELKEGWCCSTTNLKKIIIPPSNGQFIFKDDKYLLGKSDNNSDEYDILLFANRDLTKISIPTNIKIISSYAFSRSKIESIFIPQSVSKICEGAFDGCYMLTKVDFPENSNLQTIEQNAFSRSKIKEIYIPANVSKIGELAFSHCIDLQKVEIPENSKLQIIERYTFLYSQIEEIYFPSCLKELKEGWCCSTTNLKKIIIPPSNGQFIFKDDKYLLGKSDNNSDEYDILLFANRDLTKISIPTNIKIISSYAFSGSKIEEISIPQSVSKICKDAFLACKQLTKVKIPENSKLQIIGKGAFSSSKIESIFIPASVSKICENAFSHCIDLQKVEIPENSKLQIIERYAFLYSHIEEIYFPSCLKELEEGWCRSTTNLKKIIISPSNNQFIFKDDKYLLGKSDSQSDEYDILLFAYRDIDEISIPPSVSKICERAFYDCNNLIKVEIPANSKLQIIGKEAFSRSKIESIFIPASVSKICENAFFECEMLTKVEIPKNSNLQTIEKNAFSRSKIGEIYIPKTVSKIGEQAFRECKMLTKVSISKQSKLQIIEKDTFRYTNIQKICIPPSVTKICESAFLACFNLIRVGIYEDSKLQTIEKGAFAYTKIRGLYFPSNLRELEDGWCRDTSYLHKFKISPSNDQFIYKDNKYLLRKNCNNNEFDILLNVHRKIKKLCIPAFISKTSKYAFCGFSLLKSVEIPANSKMKTIESYAFENSKIEKVSISPNISRICSYAFSNCKHLKIVEIPTNSNLQIIEKSALASSNIESIIIPPNVSQIGEYAFSFCVNLQIVEISEKSKLHSIPQYVFEQCTKALIMIPASLQIYFE